MLLDPSDLACGLVWFKVWTSQSGHQASESGDQGSSDNDRIHTQTLSTMSTPAITFMGTSPESCDHLRQAIDDEINSLEAKSRRNALALISRLPPETLATIFTFLSDSAWKERSVDLECIRVTHVCRRWREVALDHSRLWSHINFTKLTPAGLVEIVARAKIAPLHLVADVGKGRATQVEFFGKQLEAHISHTRHLSIRGSFKSALMRLLSFAHASAPTLESFSLSHKSYRSKAIVPNDLFNCTAPNLTSLKLERCHISWKSPLLKGLRNLHIHDIYMGAKPKLEDWLDALNEMPNIKTLSFQHSTPLAPRTISEPSRTITLPFLTHFRICAFAKDCALALAPLLMPALTRLHVDVDSFNEEGEDVRLVIPYMARNVYVLQDIEPIRSILIAGERQCTEVDAWSIPDVDVEVCDLDTLHDMSRSACLQFSAHGHNWRNGVDSAIFDALLAVLPMNSVLTFSAQNHTRLSKEFWLSQAPRWPLLEQACLVPGSVGAFTEVLAEDTPPDGPRFPLLTKLILFDVKLTAIRAFHLRDMLIERVEQGVPLQHLDLRTCLAVNRAIQLLAEIVVDVERPLDAPPTWMEFSFDHIKMKNCDEVEYDGRRQRPWTSGDMGDSEDEVEDDDEDEDEDEPEYDESD